MLADDFPEARVVTFGYDASVAKFSRLWRGVDTSGLADYGKNLAHAVRNTRQAVDGEHPVPALDVPIYFIGHSLGGLASLEYALNYAPKDRLLYIITLGSPLHGTYFSIGFGPCIKQMRMDSPYLQKLHQQLKEATHIRLLTIGSNTDALIIPHSSALLPEIPYAQCEEIEALGHVAFLFSPRILRRIIAYLRKNGVVA